MRTRLGTMRPTKLRRPQIETAEAARSAAQGMVPSLQARTSRPRPCAASSPSAQEVYAATEVGPRNKRHQEGGHAERQALVGNAREAAQRKGHAVRNRLGPHDHNGVDGSAHEARDSDARKDHGPATGTSTARYQVDQKRGEKRADKGHGLPEHRMSWHPECRHEPEQARPGVDAHHARRRKVVVERGLQEQTGAGKRCTAAHAR